MSSDQEALPRAVRRVVWCWLALGAGALAVALALLPPELPAARHPGLGWVVPALFVLAVLLGALKADYFTHRVRGSEAPEELALVAALCLVAPGWALLIALTGSVVVSAIHPGGWARTGFNTGWAAVAASAAALAYAAVGPADPFGPAGMLAATAAVFAYVTVNWAAVGMLRRGFTPHLGFVALVRTGLADHVLASAYAGATGLVGAALLVRAPLLLPLLSRPVLLQRRRLHQQFELQRARQLDHERLQRTVDGASDGIALVDRRGRVEVWNPTMADLTGVAEEDALGRSVDAVLHVTPLDEGEGAAQGTCQLRPADGPERTVLLDRSDIVGAEGVTGTVLVVRDVTAQAELDRLREDLVSRVSHELRTPLASVSGLLETVLVRWDGLEEPRRIELVDRASRATARLTRLVSTLLTHARIERVATPVVTEPVVLAETVDELLAELGEVLGVEVDVHADPTVVARADAGHVAQILTALLTNATTYGRAPFAVVVDRDGPQARVVVSDDGDGVPDTFVDDLFTPFAQASTGLQRTAQGLGLGLSISHRLAEANGGQLTYEPRPATPGARFVLRLPAVDEAVADPPGPGSVAS